MKEQLNVKNKKYVQSWHKSCFCERCYESFISQVLINRVWFDFGRDFDKCTELLPFEHRSGNVYCSKSTKVFRVRCSLLLDLGHYPDSRGFSPDSKAFSVNK